MAVKVFVNHVDRYIGTALAELLSESVVGATVEEADDEEEEEVDGEGEHKSEKPEEKYTVIGTLSSPDAKPPAGIHTVVRAGDRAGLMAQINECQYIVYDISRSAEQAEEAGFVVSKLHEQLDEWEGQKTFVCLSTVLTWAKTKPIDPDDEEAPFQEGDYRKRRAHKHFKTHIDTEKLVTKCGKKTRGKLNTFVVASGLTYGMGEDTFHPLFRMAWELKVSALPIYGDGNALVPTIHVKDLANIALHILEGHAETRYMLALDESQSSNKEIATTLARELGPGKAAPVSAEEAFLEEDVTEVEYDMLTVNLRMEPTSVADMPFEWVSREGLVENLPAIVAEYKEKRGLQPVKICVLGPPASGKTSLAKMLSEMYKLPRVGSDNVLEETIAALKESAARLDAAANGEHPGEEEEEDLEQAEADKEMLAELEQTKAEQGHYDESQILACFKHKLESMPCRNQGYVLEGFPTNEEGAKELFDITEEDESGDTEEGEVEKKLPEFVFALDAEDEQLKERVRHLQQEEAETIKATEAEFVERLSAYRAANTEDTTVLNFFDFHEIHPKHLDAIAKTTEDLAREVQGVVGQPHNYGPTPEEREEMERLAAELKAQEVARAARELAEKEAIEEAKRKGAQAIWEAKVKEVKQQEQEALDQAALPLRTFLMRHVMPTLTEGLLDVCKVKPDDPVDYLAEYLFRNNPQID